MNQNYRRAEMQAGIFISPARVASQRKDEIINPTGE
jgi:hypothetical protein